jgi:hypothetical protein
MPQAAVGAVLVDVNEALDVVVLDEVEDDEVGVRSGVVWVECGSCVSLTVKGEVVDDDDEEDDELAVVVDCAATLAPASSSSVAAASQARSFILASLAVR